MQGDREETKTIKYLNKSDYDEDSGSESETEKLCQQEFMLARKIYHNSRPAHSNPQDSHGNCKIVVIETLHNYGPQRSQAHPPHPKSKHKKGKSMDLEELFTDSREDNKLLSQLDSSKEKKKSNKDKSEYRDRKTISEMKHYGTVSKKANPKNGSELPKKKKAKSTASNDLKIKKQFKKLLDDTPVLPRSKKGSKDSQRSHNHSLSLNSKRLKNYSRSEELFCQPKGGRKCKSRNDVQTFRQVSFSMPLTSKIIRLFSNNSSVISSHPELQTVPRRGQCFIIPTQQSCTEIDEIRHFEGSSLKKKKSSSSLRQLRKATPINSLQDCLSGQQASTSSIIQQYINHFQTESRHIPSSILDQRSPIKNQEYPDQQQLLASSIGEMHNVPLSNSVQFEHSDEIEESSAVGQSQQDIQKLNLIITEIEKKGSNIASGDKNAIMDRIRNIIGMPSAQKQHQKRQQLSIESDKANELTNSQLKESINFDENMAQLNLDLLDKALREREAYLIDRKERQLNKLDEILDNDMNLQAEKQKIVKWIDHQIKSVVHTRHQLWKGFNFAKQILETDNEIVNGRKGEMMKCLSEKYFDRVIDKRQRKVQKKVEKRQQAESSEKDSDSDEELGKGRVSSVDKNKQGQLLQQVKCDDEPEQEQELLLTETKKQERIEHFQQEEQKEASDSDQQYNNKNVLNRQVDLATATQHVTVPQSIGLNLKSVECESDDIDYEDSYNQKQLQKMVIDSQQNQEKQKKLPMNLSIDDKEDIYEFIFLDLCVELTDEYSINSRVIQKIFSFIKNMKQQSKKAKGFKTNSNAIKQYLFEFISYLKNKEELLHEVYNNLDKPLGPTALDILKYMHPSDDEYIEEESNETVFILDIKLFEMFESEYLPRVNFEKYYEDEEKEKKRRAFLKNAIHIHNKAIFDALNETLDKERPFGVWGEPFSWKKIPKFYHQRTVSNKNNVMLKSAQRTIQYGAFMCGFMIDKEDCNLKGNPNISQSYIQQIRDDRLSRMLANDLEEGEEKMLFIDDEETEILVEVGHLIYQSLISQALREFATGR